MTKPAPPRIILASGSTTRRDMLRNAGIDAEAIVPGVDEDEIKASMKAAGANVEAVADSLATLKAVRVSAAHTDALVIGADQMLECRGEWFDKPHSMEAARANLSSLRGQSHDLVTAAVVAKNGSAIWRTTDRATLTMRDFSDAFLSHYLRTCGDDVLGSVGCYRLEGPGAQLFTSVRGDFFTVLGLPLLPLLAFLRDSRAVLP